MSKIVDSVLQAGMPPGADAVIASSRWDAVQRLSAILHETHDAEVQAGRKFQAEVGEMAQAVRGEEEAMGRQREEEMRRTSEERCAAEMMQVMAEYSQVSARSHNLLTS